MLQCQKGFYSSFGKYLLTFTSNNVIFLSTLVTVESVTLSEQFEVLYILVVVLHRRQDLSQQLQLASEVALTVESPS